ncbi:glycosyltransferase family 4 protein [Candidatus Gottesmanbacteria bacterium]|nr:glycosyltransferase family 4 protein [Candidatus Gottesmanbacteria bacterium]
MKIALVHNLPAGGQKRAFFEQVKRLSTHHQLDLFIPVTANESYLPLIPFVREVFSFSFRYYPRFPANLYSVYVELPQMYKKMAEAINTRSYDMVFAGSCFLTQTPYIFRYLRVPSIYFCPEPKREFYETIPRVSNHLTYSLTLPFRLPLKSIDRTNARNATRIVTISQFAKTQVDNAYGSNSRVNYLGVDAHRFKPSDEKKEHIILTVGDFSLLKGHDFLIRVLSHIPKSTRPTLVVIGNEGVEKEYLENLAKEKGVKIEIYDGISDDQLVRWYNRAKVFTYASSKEPFGLVLLEAACCGIPIIAVEDGGIAEILRTVPQSIMVSRDENVFAEALTDRMADRPSIGERKLQNALISKKWSWEKTVERLEKIMREIV